MCDLMGTHNLWIVCDKYDILILHFPDRSYMRLTEKENETLPIDVSDFEEISQLLFVFHNIPHTVVSLVSFCRLYYRPYCHL